MASMKAKPQGPLAPEAPKAPQINTGAAKPSPKKVVRKPKDPKVPNAKPSTSKVKPLITIP